MRWMILLFTSLAFAKSMKNPPVVAPPPPEPPPAPVDPLATMPTVGAEVPFALPTPETAELQNGASVWVVPNKALPLVSVVIQVPGGSALDVPGKEGAAWLSDRLMTQGAGERDATAFAAAVERLGIDLEVSTGRASSTIELTAMKDKLDPALDLVADMILRPRYGGKDLKRERGLGVQDLVLAQDEPVVVASRLAWASWFGPEHPYGRPAEGTVAGLGKVGKKDVKAYHQLAWNGAGAAITVAGDVTRDEIVAKLEPRLGAAWPAGVVPTMHMTPVPAHTGEVLIVDRPGSAQTVFYLVFAGVPFAEPALPAARAGTIVLGGTFTSRLNGLLREKRGYTYGVRAGVQPLFGAGIYTISTRIRTDASGPAMTDLVGELTRIREGIDADELRKARGAWRQDLVEAMETRSGTAGAFATWNLLGKPPGALQDELGRFQALTPEQVGPAMAPYDPNKALIVLVGDKRVIEGPLKEAGIATLTVREPL